MNETRIKQLFSFLEEDPDDPFTLYAIATEYNTSDPLKALEYYEKLLREHEDYVGTYYHAAHLYSQLGNSHKARETFEKGLKVASQQNNRLAHRELQNAYNTFLDEEEE